LPLKRYEQTWYLANWIFKQDNYQKLFKKKKKKHLGKLESRFQFSLIRIHKVWYCYDIF